MIENMELQRKPRGSKVYTGFYNYLQGGTVYCEEEFEVYKDRQELSLSFFANQHISVATGELLNIYLDYTVTKDFIPQKVLIRKSLGKESVAEIYEFNAQENILDYIFLEKENKVHKQIPTPPQFTITTPCTCTSMLHLKSKKEDTTAKNYYQIISSTNYWTFENAPITQTLIMERIGLGSENINIGGSSISATTYKIFGEEQVIKGQGDSPLSFLKVYLSKYSTIPYLIESQDQTRIQIKYLNNHDKDH